MKKITACFIFIITVQCASNITYAESPSITNTDNIHQGFDAVLKDHVTDGQVDYTSIQQDSRFHNYLSAIQNINPKNFATKQQQLAFWINAYNALAIKGIIDNLSPSSLFGRYSFFKSTNYKVAGQTINLDDLEKKIIIPFEEPRIHFAIVCASASCPKLRSEAYLASRLNEQLETNTYEFLNNENKNQFNSNKKVAKVSKIFDWFTDDFEKHSGSVQKYIAQYVDNKALKIALSNESYKIKYLKYDWQLNGTFSKQR